MATKKTQAAKRVINKLSALRATLTKSEREILDQIVTNARLEFGAEEPEVRGHTLKDGQVTAAKDGARIGKTEIGVRAGARISKRDAGAKFDEEPEVQGHMVKDGQVTAAKTPTLTGQNEVGAVTYAMVITGDKYGIVSS